MPGYDGNNLMFDVGVVFIKNPITFTEDVRPICLPDSPQEDDDSNENDLVGAVGEFLFEE